MLYWSFLISITRVMPKTGNFDFEACAISEILARSRQPTPRNRRAPIHDLPRMLTLPADLISGASTGLHPLEPHAFRASRHSHGRKRRKLRHPPGRKIRPQKKHRKPRTLLHLPVSPLRAAGKPDLRPRVQDTFDARLHRSHDCWSQDDIQMAFLGRSRASQRMAGQACFAHLVQRKAASRRSGTHFTIGSPMSIMAAFLQMALQLMLLQGG